MDDQHQKLNRRPIEGKSRIRDKTEESKHNHSQKEKNETK